jgi:hypothetical protein
MPIFAIDTLRLIIFFAADAIDTTSSLIDAAAFAIFAAAAFFAARSRRVKE